jgi:lipopolysaccharide/colanic/teichoic acid biosynthesis glycosyltransferase
MADFRKKQSILRPEDCPWDDDILSTSLDSWYVRNWNLWLDIVILFKTVKVVFKKEGAY